MSVESISLRWDKSKHNRRYRRAMMRHLEKECQRLFPDSYETITAKDLLINKADQRHSRTWAHRIKLIKHLLPPLRGSDSIDNTVMHNIQWRATP